MNPTNTNQASEDELELIVARISAGIGGFGKLTSGTRYDGISEEAGIELLKAYIRTEKLKLLAEVGERVVGKNSNTHWSACNNHGKGKPNYKCVCGLEAANDSRTAQLAALTKLEAEL